MKPHRPDFKFPLYIFCWFILFMPTYSMIYLFIYCVCVCWHIGHTGYILHLLENLWWPMKPSSGLLLNCDFSLFFYTVGNQFHVYFTSINPFRKMSVSCKRRRVFSGTSVIDDAVQLFKHYKLSGESFFLSVGSNARFFCSKYVDQTWFLLHLTNSEISLEMIVWFLIHNWSPID